MNKEITYDKLKVQAEKMKQLSQKKFSEIQIGKLVTVPISSLDRGKADTRSILNVIIKRPADVL